MKSVSLSSKIIIITVFTLTLISLLIAGVIVPSLESERQENDKSISSLQEVYTLESQRFGQHTLNLSAAAQIISSERILKIISNNRYVFTRNALLEQGDSAVISGMRERRVAIIECIEAVRNITIEGNDIKPVIKKTEITEVPSKSAAELFSRFNEEKRSVVMQMQEQFKKIQKVDKDYKHQWIEITKQIRNIIQELKNKNTIIDFKISFYMKIALGIQVLAMLLIFLKDIIGN